MVYVRKQLKEVWTHKEEIVAGVVIGSGGAATIGLVVYALLVFFGSFSQAVAQQ